MAKINLSESFGSAVFEGFGGIDRARVGKGGVGVVDLNNFRVGTDGTLTKRPGFAPLAHLPEGKVRAICSTPEGSVFALIGSSVYEIDSRTGVCSLKNTVKESDLDACFFNYATDLYLMDGNELYTYNGSQFTLTEGYIPLYGKDWPPAGSNVINEPLNAFSSKIRISYKMTASSTSRVSLPFPIKSIDRVHLNGRNDSLSNYKKNANSNTLLDFTQPCTAGDVLEVFYTPNTTLIADARKKIAACARAESIGVGFKNGILSTLVLYGGASTHEVYASKTVSQSALNTVRSAFPDVVPIYFDPSNFVAINHNDPPIKAACKSGTRLAIFTDTTAYIMDEPAANTAPSAIPISYTSGCAIKDCAITLESSPVTVSKNGILRWSLNELIDEYTTEHLSLPISELLSETVGDGCSAFYNTKNELWFYRSVDRRAWIYNTVLKCWYSFSGFSPEKMLEIDGRMAFVQGSTLYVFDEFIFYDETEDGAKEIDAYLLSDMMSFGAPNRKKRLSRAMVAFSAEGSPTLTVTDAEDTSIEIPILVTGEEKIDYYETRIPAKRSRYYSFTLSHSAGPIKLYAIALSAVK